MGFGNGIFMRGWAGVLHPPSSTPQWVTHRMCLHAVYIHNQSISCLYVVYSKSIGFSFDFKIMTWYPRARFLIYAPFLRSRISCDMKIDTVRKV